MNLMDTRLTQKLCFYTLNNELEREIKQSILQLHQKIKYIELNLTKLVKYLYTENSKTLMTKFSEDTPKLKYLCLRIQKIILK